MEVWERARERRLVSLFLSTSPARFQPLSLSFLRVYCKGTWYVRYVNFRALVSDSCSLANLFGLDARGRVLARR